MYPGKTWWLLHCIVLIRGIKNVVNSKELAFNRTGVTTYVNEVLIPLVIPQIDKISSSTLHEFNKPPLRIIFIYLEPNSRKCILISMEFLSNYYQILYDGNFSRWSTGTVMPFTHTKQTFRFLIVIYFTSLIKYSDSIIQHDVAFMGKMIVKWKS